MIKLTERLQKIYDQVRPGESVCDVGTDHGYVPLALLESGRSRTSTIGLDDLCSVKDLVLQIVRPGDAVLVKGSNSTQIGQVAEHIRNNSGKAL